MLGALSAIDRKSMSPTIPAILRRSSRLDPSTSRISSSLRSRRRVNSQLLMRFESGVFSSCATSALKASICLYASDKRCRSSLNCSMSGCSSVGWPVPSRRRSSSLTVSERVCSTSRWIGSMPLRTSLNAPYETTMEPNKAAHPSVPARKDRSASSAFGSRMSSSDTLPGGCPSALASTETSKLLSFSRLLERSGSEAAAPCAGAAKMPPGSSLIHNDISACPARTSRSRCCSSSGE